MIGDAVDQVAAAPRSRKLKVADRVAQRRRLVIQKTRRVVDLYNRSLVAYDGVADDLYRAQDLFRAAMLFADGAPDLLYDLRQLFHRLRDVLGGGSLLLHRAPDLFGQLGHVQGTLADLLGGRGLLRGRALDLLRAAAHLAHQLRDLVRFERLCGRSLCDLANRGGGHSRLAADLVERERGTLGQLRPLNRKLAIANDLLDGCADRFAHPFNQLVDLFGRACGSLRQLLDLFGDDGEAASLLTGLRGEDARVQSEQVRAISDLVDHARDRADAVRALAERRNHFRVHFDAAPDRAHGFRRLKNDARPLLGRVLHLFGEHCRLADSHPDALRRIVNGAHRALGLVRGGGQRFGRGGDVAHACGHLL